MGDFEAEGLVTFCGEAFGGFAEAEDVGTVGGEVLLAAAGVGVGAFEGRPDDVEEVAVGPVVAFDQRPEGDHQGIDVGIGPRAGR